MLLKLIGAVLPLRADAEDETVGIDLSQHGEEAYVHAAARPRSAFSPGLMADWRAHDAVKAIIRPDKVDAVKDALVSRGVPA